MTVPKSFPDQKNGRYFLTEGGTKTEIMYKLGFELQYFALFPLLDNLSAMSKLRDML